MNGKQFKSWMHDRGLSQSQAAILLKSSRSTLVRAMSNEERMIKDDLAEKVAEYEIKRCKEDLDRTLEKMTDIGNKLYLMSQGII